MLNLASIHMALHELGVDEKIAWWGLHNFWSDSKRSRIQEIFESLSDELRKIMNEPGVFVYSSEFLFMQKEIHIIALDMFLSRFFENRSYVVYIRDTVDLFMSAYSQMLKERNSRFNNIEFSKFMDECVNAAIRDCEENYFHEMFVWNSIVGQCDQLLVWDRVVGQRLNVRLLESDWMTGGNIINDFSSVVGINAFRIPPIMNESIAVDYIEYLRFLNTEFGETLSIEIRRKIVRILTAMSTGKPKLSISDERAKAIGGPFREKEEKIRKRFFQNKHILFSPKSRDRCVMPVPLTNRRKLDIESEIRENLTPHDWESFSFFAHSRKPWIQG